MATAVQNKNIERENTGKDDKEHRGVFGIIKNSAKEFMDDECLNLSAAIAYYALQSLIPLILGFIALGSLFLQDPATRQDFINGVKGAIPQQIGEATNFNNIIDGLIQGASAAGIISVITLLWTGSGIFDQFIFAINKAYDVEKDERNFFFKLFLRISMLVGLGLLLGLAFTITIVFNLVFNTDLALFGISVADFKFLLPVLSFVLPFFLEFAIFTILYKFSGARKGVRWKPVLVGAAVAAFLFELLKAGFTFYVTAFGAADSATRTYGALGGIIVFMLFVYLAGAVILFGAEVVGAISNFRSGMATVKTEDSVVEAKGEQQSDGSIEPAEDQPGEIHGEEESGEKEKVSTTARSSHQNEEQQVRVTPRPSLYAPGESKPDKRDLLTMGLGALVLAVAAVWNFLFRRRGATQ
jgi:membrane protein